MKHASKKAALGFVVILTVVGIGLISMVRIGWRNATKDPLEVIGTSWNPERIRHIAAKGRSLFDIPDHVSTAIRLADPAQLDLLKRGEPASAAGHVIAASDGSRSYPADGSAWGEPGPCMVWQFDGLDLTRDRNVGGIEVQINDRRDGDHKFHISFSVWSPDNLEGVVRNATVPLVPKRTMKYVILPDMSAQPDNAGAFDAKTITLVFPDIDDPDQVEVVSLRVLSKTAGYAGLPLGGAYESLDEETRPIIYQWTDGAASWKVMIPDVDSALKFGTGLLPNSSPVTFKASVEWKGRRQEIFNETIEKSDVWVDRVVELHAWSGQEVALTFTAESDASEVALWSSPRIVETGRKGKFFCIYLIDALRPDFVDGMGTFRGRSNSTPAIRDLAKEGVTFTSALANAPLTKYSMPALFSGLYPSHTGVMTYQRVPDDIRTLAEVFRQNGFVTASFSFNGNSGRLRGLHQGFDHLFSIGKVYREALRSGDRNDPDALLEARALASGAVITDFLYDFIKSHQEEDVFLFIHLMDTHTPYLPDAEFLESFLSFMSANNLKAPPDREALLGELQGWSGRSPSDRLPEEALLELYRGTVATADKHLRRFLDFLEREGIRDRSTIVLTADHGEHLNEHPDVGVFMHQHPMLLEVLRVPLIIQARGRIPAGSLVSEPVQLADVMPTLLDLAGIAHDASHFDGVSLLLLTAGESDDYFEARPIISQSYPYWSILMNGSHSPDITAAAHLSAFLRGKRVEIYDVARDPREHVPLNGKTRRERVEALVKSLALIPRRSVPETETIMNEEEVLKQLKTLGYIQ